MFLFLSFLPCSLTTTTIPPPPLHSMTAGSKAYSLFGAKPVKMAGASASSGASTLKTGPSGGSTLALRASAQSSVPRMAGAFFFQFKVVR